MSLNSIIILAACVIIGIIIDLFIVATFLSKAKRRKRFYKEIASKSNFKLIEADSYVLKTNRFGDIVKNDFLIFRDGDVKIAGGIMKYNVDEHIVFCDCLIEGTSNSGKKCRPFVYNAVLHLRKLPVKAAAKIRLDSKVVGACPAIFDDFKFIFPSDGFIVSSDVEMKIDAFPVTFSDLLREYKTKFPFAKPKQNGLMIINDKGWFILSVSAVGKDMLESLVELDRKISEAFSKKHV